MLSKNKERYLLLSLQQACRLKKVLFVKKQQL
jgi:hypothetical protein